MAMAMAFNDDNDIDEHLHFHHLAVYGRETMRRISNSKVLVAGMQGLGAEIAKNLILAGMKAVTLQDEGVVELWDLSGNFIFTENDIGKNRAIASVQKLQELNKSVVVSALSTKLTTDQLSGFQAVVFTGIGLEEAIELDYYCHNHQPPIPFIKAEIRGLFGHVFCDFGPEFVVLDVDGKDTSTGIIASISNDNPAKVNCVEDGKVECYDGDMVVFSEVKGMTQLNDGKPRKVKSPVCPDRCWFTIDEDTTNLSAHLGGGIVTRVKEPVVLNFKPLKDAIIDPGDFEDSDFTKSDNTPLLHLAFQALDKFVSQQRRLPLAGSNEDARKLIFIVRDLNEKLSSDRKVEDIDPKLLRQFAFGARAVLSPMAAIFGGIVGQEVIKACSGQFRPIFQFMYFDSVESLPSKPLEASDFRPLYNRYDAQISVFGSSLQKKLEDAVVFVARSGALGCELLKNLALMGVSCGKKGKLTITDEDVIVKNNLSSHFLFREGNIGQLKSTAAASAVASINQHLNIEVEPFQKFVGPERKTVFDYAFWEKLDVVVKAMSINNRTPSLLGEGCLYFNKPYIESNTDGTSCSTVCFIPRQTGTYDYYRDKPEIQAPMWAINSFPYKIDHCLTWARSEFEVLLGKRIADANVYLSNPSEYTSAMRKAGDAKATSTLERVLECLNNERCESFQDCIQWARLRFEEYFADDIKQLIFDFPEDDGRFWSAPKRFPCPLHFSDIDPTHLHFIMAASILCAETFGIAVPEWVAVGDSMKLLRQEVIKLKVPEFKPTKVENIVTVDEKTASTSHSNTSVDNVARFKRRKVEKVITDPSLDEVARMDCLVSMLEQRRKNIPPDFRMTPIQFHQDDDRHIGLISAMANMRARNFSIPEVDKLKAKLIAAGGIVPDLATSSAVASGLVCLELYKVLDGGHNVFDYRNALTDLAEPMFNMSETFPPMPNFHNKEWWTLWDRWEIKNNPTVKQVFEWLAEKGLTGLKVSWVNCVLYESDSTLRKDRQDMKVVDLARQVANVEIPPHRDYIDVKIACVDDANKNVYIPLVSVYFR